MGRCKWEDPVSANPRWPLVSDQTLQIEISLEKFLSTINSFDISFLHGSLESMLILERIPDSTVSQNSCFVRCF